MRNLAASLSHGSDPNNSVLPLTIQQQSVISANNSPQASVHGADNHHNHHQHHNQQPTNLSPVHHHHSVSPMTYTQQIPSPITATSTPNDIIYNYSNNNSIKNLSSSKSLPKFLTVRHHNQSGTDGPMYHATSQIITPPSYSPVQSPHTHYYNVMSPGLVNEHDVKIEGMHGHHQAHHLHPYQQQLPHHLNHHQQLHIIPHPHISRSPSNDGETDQTDQHLHELQSHIVPNKMERLSVVNIKME